MNKYMEIANDLAKENNKTNVGGPFGAVVVKNGEIVGKGSNHVIVNNDPTAHAEVMAIRDACKNLNTYDLKECEIYTSCYPCPMCLSAIIWANIGKIYYGNTKKDAASIGFRDEMIYNVLNNLTGENEILEFIEIDRDETIKTFEDYKNNENKIVY